MVKPQLDPVSEVQKIKVKDKEKKKVKIPSKTKIKHTNYRECPSQENHSSFRRNQE